jgi:hypothetical protein
MADRHAQQIADALRTGLAPVVDLDPFPARLCLGDGTGTLVASSSLPRGVNINFDTQQGRQQTVAILPDDTICPYENNVAVENLPVIVAMRGGYLTITRLNGIEGYSATAQGTPSEQKGTASYFPSVDRLATLRVDVAQPSGLAVSIVSAGGVYKYTKPSTGATATYAGGLTLLGTDIAAAVAALLSTGNHQVGWVCLDYENNIEQLVLAAAVTGPGSGLPDADTFTDTDFDAMSIPSGYKPIIPIYLYDGQSSVAATDFYRGSDKRLEYPLPASYLPLAGGTLTGALGSTVLALTSSPATNDDPIEKFVQNRAATTDATVTTLHTFTIPASTTYAITIRVVARRTGGASGTAEDGAYYERAAAIKNAAGTATLIGAVAAIATMEDQAGWDCTIDVTGATARVRVTGAVANNITWHMSARTYQVSA